MSDRSDQLQRDLNSARKARDQAGVLLLGTIIAEVKYREIETKHDATDDDVIEVIRKGIKKRRESVELYDKGNRPELADKERAEVAALERYLPQAPSDDEIRAAVREAIAGGAANIGTVMGAVMPKFKGRVDGGAINQVAREELAKK